MIRSAAEILREYGRFPGVDHVHGVTFDGQHVWFASRDKLNAFDPASGKTVRSIPPSSSSRAGCPSPATRPVRALRCGPTLARGGRGGRWKRPFDFPILLAPFYSPVAGYWDWHPLHPDIATIAAGSYRHKDPPAIRGTGYVVASLEAALWAFARTENFRDGCMCAVNLGEDADTTDAVNGQIAGAFYGASGIPAAWRGMLERAGPEGPSREGWRAKAVCISYPPGRGAATGSLGTRACGQQSPGLLQVCRVEALREPVVDGSQQPVSGAALALALP